MKEAITSLDWNSIIKKYFVELVNVVKSGVDFASKEVPLYLKELITYEFWSSSLYALAFAATAIASTKLLFHCRKRWNTETGDEQIPYVMAGIISLIIAIVFTCKAVNQIDNAIKAKVAPRVIIVEKIQELIKDTAPSCSGK